MPRPACPPRLAVYAGCACALAAVAAVVSFVRGGWVGIAWLLLSGLASNMAWYHARRGADTAGKGTGARAGAGLPKAGPAPVGCENAGACGVCVKTTLKESR